MTLSITAPSPALTGRARNAEGDPLSARVRPSLGSGAGATSACDHELGGLPCANPRPHAGIGHGCVHLSTSGVPDRHDYGDDE